jgi:hypothetical protein
VNLDKLNKQLRRDLAANPKKGVALGLMVLVALYFWGPLVWKWTVASGRKSAAKVNMASLILTDDPAVPSQQVKSRGGARFRWEKVRQLIHNDPRMVSATFEVGWIDPFAKPGALAPAPQVVEISTEETNASSVPIEPETYGFVLTSVLIGPRSRAAVINGEPCREGDLLEIPDKIDKTVIRKVRVLEIRRQLAVLEVDGTRVTIEQNKPKVAHGDQIERRTPRERN